MTALPPKPVGVSLWIGGGRPYMISGEGLELERRKKQLEESDPCLVEGRVCVFKPVC